VAARSLIPRLSDMIEAIEHINSEVTSLTLDAFEADWRHATPTRPRVAAVAEQSGSSEPAIQREREGTPPFPSASGFIDVLSNTAMTAPTRRSRHGSGSDHMPTMTD
jgi:hypothetical protein